MGRLWNPTPGTAFAGCITNCAETQPDLRAALVGALPILLAPKETLLEP